MNRETNQLGPVLHVGQQCKHFTTQQSFCVRACLTFNLFYFYFEPFFVRGKKR